MSIPRPLQAIVVDRSHVSGMSAKARSLGPERLANKPAEFALLDRLLKLSLAHDRQLTY